MYCLVGVWYLIRMLVICLIILGNELMLFINFFGILISLREVSFLRYWRLSGIFLSCGDR